MSKTQIIKVIATEGITAAKKMFGNSKDKGVASLSDEQLGRGLNMFEKKKAEKKAAKAPKPKAKKKPKSPPRDVQKAATQKGLRFRDKPTVDIEVESDASRSVDETNLIRGARSAGRSTNQTGRTNVGRMSMANFIKDASKNYGVVQKRKKIEDEFQRRINLADTEAQKDKLKAARQKLRDQFETKDVRDQKAVGRKISTSLRGKKRSKPQDDFMSARDAASDGDLNTAFFRLNKNKQDQVMRHAKATLQPPQYRRMMALREQKQLREGKTPQLERGEAITVAADVSKKTQDTALKALEAVYPAKRAQQILDQKLAKAESVREFNVEIRSMVDKAKGKAGNKSGDIGAVVRGRGSSLDDASPDRGRKLNKGGMMKKGIPVITIGLGMAAPKGKKKRTGSTDYRNGGMVMSSTDNLKPVPKGNKGLGKLPKPVRNRMGFMNKGGMVKK